MAIISLLREATQPWILEDSTGQQSHRGKIERPLSNAASGTGYFMFIQEGSELVPLPVSEWYTFKPANRKTQFKTLEEAERAIKNSRSSEGGPEGRLAQWTRGRDSAAAPSYFPKTSNKLVYSAQCTPVAFLEMTTGALP